MAVYKLIQDIEAEDKLIGPLTLKGFIYAVITAMFAFINYRIIITFSLGSYRWPMLIIFVLPMILFGILASPLGHDQPTEVWLLSHIRFFLKPRVRIWNQSGVKELVTITAPKKIEQPLTRDITQGEINSRLKALANTLDSRGWAVKNVAVNESSLVDYLQASSASSDRLIPADSVLTDQSAGDIQASDDILDPQNNPKAQKVEQLLETNAQQRKAAISKSLKQPAQGKTSPPVSPAPAAVTAPGRTAKLKELAQSGSALSVASLAKLANHASRNQSQAQKVSSNEVVIALH